MPQQVLDTSLAAGALAAERLAPRRARVAGIVGTIEEAGLQLLAAARVRPFERLLVFGEDTQAAAYSAVELGEALGVDGEIITNVEALFEQCDFVVGEASALSTDRLHAGLHVTVLRGAGAIDDEVLALADLVTTDAACDERRNEADITICDLTSLQ